ncbi:hypothetical protein [Streptomyces purpureus]|uniref:Uncharacterized protein n=1 Tax=Streptomyces purpureus TaxID=1951 RepID=A0A918H1V3_9ACTN|nr:hypothetical protein [Streptomyces purpureus]GGT28174.1 hypothetical protein GCM10014713_22190 [Streptomyces purpureus]
MSVPRGEPPPRPVPEPAPEPEPRSAPPPPTGTFFDKAAYVVAPGTAVIGLLYYFGSVYTDSYYAGFGVPSADLQLSVQAYLAKGPDAVFGPVWFLLVCGLVVLLVLGRIGHVLARSGNELRRRAVSRWFLAVGILMVLLGFPLYFGEASLLLPASWWGTRIVPSFVVALGATLAFFAVQQRLQRSAENQERHDETADRMWSAGGALLIGLLALSLFFGMTRYVDMQGGSHAWDEIQGGHEGSLPVVVYSRIPIVHHADGIKHEDMGIGKGPYRHQYRGFRLLVKSPSRFYLVTHASRVMGYPLAVVLPDNDTVRVELTSPVS